MPDRTRRRPWLAWIGLTVLVVLTLVSFAPVISLVVSMQIADWNHCQVDEGSAHPCIIGGVDLGGALQVGAVFGWLMLLTAPGMLASVLVWLILAVRWALRRRRAASARCARGADLGA